MLSRLVKKKEKKRKEKLNHLTTMEHLKKMIVDLYSFGATKMAACCFPPFFWSTIRLCMFLYIPGFTKMY